MNKVKVLSDWNLDEFREERRAEISDGGYLYLYSYSNLVGTAKTEMFLLRPEEVKLLKELLNEEVK